MLSSVKAGYRPDQSRGADGRWVPEGRANQVFSSRMGEDRQKEFMDALEVLEKAHPGTKDMVIAMTGDLPQLGYGGWSEISDFDWDGKNLTIYGDIKFKGVSIIDGHTFYGEAGDWERTIAGDTIIAEGFGLRKAFQGEGIGTYFHKTLEEFARKAGYDNISLHANMDIGGYAWTKLGFDFTYPGAKKDLLVWFEEKLQYSNPGEKKLILEELSTLEHPWEFGAYEHKPGDQLGKYLMLGSSWWGSKNLQDKGAQEMAQLYYESKGIKAGFRPDQARGSDGKWIPEGRQHWTQLQLAGMELPESILRQRAVRKYFEEWLRDSGIDDWDIQEVMDNIDDLESNNPGSMMMMMNWAREFPAYGYETTLDEISFEYYDGYRLAGSVTENGVTIGEWVRIVEDDHIHVDWFKLYPDSQGNGFGTYFHKLMEEDAWNAGYDRITLEANLNVGGYAWAKMGFDFDNNRSNSHSYMRDLFEDFFYHHPDRDTIYQEIDQLEHAWEFAAYEYEPGDEAGKHIMLGSDWWAVKYQWDAEAEQVGEMYYQSKGIKAGFRPDQMRGSDGRWVPEGRQFMASHNMVMVNGINIHPELETIREYKFPRRYVVDTDGNIILSKWNTLDYHTEIYARMILANPSLFTLSQLAHAQEVYESGNIEDTDIEHWAEMTFGLFSISGIPGWNGEVEMICKSTQWAGFSLKEQFATMVKIVQRKYKKDELDLSYQYPHRVWFFIDDRELSLDMVELEEFASVSMSESNHPYAHFKAGFRPDQTRGSDGRWVDEGVSNTVALSTRANSQDYLMALDALPDTMDNPLDPRVTVFLTEDRRDVKANVEIIPFDLYLKGEPSVEFNIIVPHQNRNRGYGTEVVKRLMALADQTGVTLVGTPSAYGQWKPRLTTAQLWRWYIRLGFKKENGMVVYRPATKAGFRPDQSRGSDGKWIPEGQARSPYYDHYEKLGLYPDKIIDGLDGWTWVSKDGRLKFKTSIFRIDHNSGGIEIRGGVYLTENDEFKGNIGSFSRFLYEKGKIYQGTFTLNPGARGNGFGSAFYNRFEQLAMDAGFKEIELYAADTVGGYAWARNGYDFMNFNDILASRRRILSVAREWFANEGYASHPDSFMAKYLDEIEAEVQTLTHSWELAAYEYDGQSFGRQALTGSSWTGSKVLDPNDEGYQVGLAYQESKGIKAGFRPDQSRGSDGRWVYEGRHRVYPFSSPLSTVFDDYSDQEKETIREIARSMGFNTDNLIFEVGGGIETDDRGRVFQSTALYNHGTKKIYIHQHLEPSELYGVLAHEINHSRLALWLDDFQQESARIFNQQLVDKLFDPNLGFMREEFAAEFPASYMWSKYLVNHNFMGNVLGGVNVSNYAEHYWADWQQTDQSMSRLVQATMETHAEIARLVEEGKASGVDLNWLQFHEAMLKYCDQYHPVD